MQCRRCGSEIPQERILFFEQSGRRCLTCVRCSTEEPVVSFTVYDHKTAGYVVTLPQTEDGRTDSELVRLAQRAYKRAR